MYFISTKSDKSFVVVCNIRKFLERYRHSEFVRQLESRPRFYVCVDPKSGAINVVLFIDDKSVVHIERKTVSGHVRYRRADSLHKTAPPRSELNCRYFAAVFRFEICQPRIIRTPPKRRYLRAFWQIRLRPYGKVRTKPSSPKIIENSGVLVASKSYVAFSG